MLVHDLNSPKNVFELVNHEVLKTIKCSKNHEVLKMRKEALKSKRPNLMIFCAIVEKTIVKKPCLVSGSGKLGGGARYRYYTAAL